MRILSYSLPAYLSLANSALSKLRGKKTVCITSEMESANIRLFTFVAPNDHCWGMDLSRSKTYSSWLDRLAERTELVRSVLEDKALEARIRLELDERFTIGTGVSGIEASARGGRVVLRGTAIHTLLAADAGSIAAAIEGVREVQNEIVVLRGRSGGSGGRRQRTVSSISYMTRVRLWLRHSHIRGGPLEMGQV